MKCHQCGNLSLLTIPVPGEEHRTTERPWYICYSCFKKNGDSFFPPKENVSG